MSPDPFTAASLTRKPSFPSAHRIRNEFENPSKNPWERAEKLTTSEFFTPFTAIAVSVPEHRGNGGSFADLAYNCFNRSSG